MYLCGVNYNEQSAGQQASAVVICLKSCIFVVSITTASLGVIGISMLWFAQKVVSLWCQLQLQKIREERHIRCDLLKKLYLCGVNYNIAHGVDISRAVVICLKSCIFVVSITTWVVLIKPGFSCDLLKKLYLCGVNYNGFKIPLCKVSVVICLKSCIFVVSITT